MWIATQNMMFLGLALIFVGLFILVLSAMILRKKNRTGGILLLGPLPIAVGSLDNPRMMQSLWMIGLLLILVYAVFLFLSE